MEIITRLIVSLMFLFSVPSLIGLFLFIKNDDVFYLKLFLFFGFINLIIIWINWIIFGSLKNIDDYLDVNKSRKNQ